MNVTDFELGGVLVNAASRVSIDLPLARLYTQTEMPLPVEVIRGGGEGPVFFLTAALHGNEINGTEIIRRVLDRLDPVELQGTVVAVPVVNVFGFVFGSRYLPDRRDLNRSFPGSKRGSLASQLAHLLVTRIIDRCSYGIDYHTAAPPRVNLPQLRADLDDPETRRCALAFGAPVGIHGKGPAGSLRQAARKKGVRLLVFEGGEPERFNADVIEIGTAGTLRVLTELDMIAGRDEMCPLSLEIRRTRWVRARRSGILRLAVSLGERVASGDTLGTISGPLGGDSLRLKASIGGIVIGHSATPLVHRGDGVVHIGVVG